MSSLEVVPLLYWYKRYAHPRLTRLALRLLTIDGTIVVASIAVFGWGKDWTDTLFVYVITRVAYTIFYELGYFVNDFWSARWESHARGEEKEVKDAGPHLFPAVATRLLFGLGLVGTVWWLGFEAWCLIIAIIAVGQIVFLIHNVLYFPVRVGTYLVLYAVRYLLIAPAVLPITFTEIVYYSLLVAPLVLGFAAKYVIDRDWLKIKSHFEFGFFNNHTQNFVIRFSYPLYLGLGIVVMLTEVSILPLLVVSMFVLGLDFSVSLARFVETFLSAYNNLDRIIHLHTKFSHDATNTLSDIRRAARRAKASEVYVTDHAEDFTPEIYMRLKSRCEEESTASVRIVPGLEYDVLGQHFLCIDLTAHEEVDSNNSRSVEGLTRRCKRVIWAHPHFKIMRWVKYKKYRKKWYTLMRQVDAMEIINFKTTRGLHFMWRHVFLAFLASICRPMPLTIGSDAHHLAELKEIRVGYPRELVWRRLTELFPGG